MTIIDDDGGAQPNEEFYIYDAIGNMLSKTGVGTYSYPATEHREQISSMLSALDVTPPDLDGWAYGEVTHVLIPIAT